mgnify:CR=1 FL=1
MKKQNEIFTSVSIDFSEGDEIRIVRVDCDSDKIIETIARIKDKHQVKRTIYEEIQTQIGSDAFDPTIDIFIRNSQYLTDEKKKRVIELIDSIKRELLDEIKKIE